MSNNTITPVGFDPGNSQTQIVFKHRSGGETKSIKASIPSGYAFSSPPGEISAKTGAELNPKVFSLVIGSKTLYFGRDILGVSHIREIDMSKYDAPHLVLLFQAALYQACKNAKIDIADLGKLKIVASMPPGLHKDAAKRKVAEGAFNKAFNRGQSHIWIKDGKKSCQIVTEFASLQKEAVGWSEARKVKPTLSLTADLGGGTNDYALLVNGVANPRRTWTDNAGLLHVYERIDRVDPNMAELEVLRDKNNLPDELLAAYSAIKQTIQKIILRLPGAKVDELNIIGGGASLMTAKIKATFTPLAAKVNILGEYANAEANLNKAIKGGQ